MVIEAEPNAPMIAENSEFGEKYGIHLSVMKYGTARERKPSTQGFGVFDHRNSQYFPA